VTSQTKTVIVALLGGVAFQALRKELGVVPDLSYLPPLDAPGPINSYMLGYWAGYWTVVPLIAAVIAIAATARKAGLRSSIFNCLGALAAIIGITAIMSGAQIAIAAIYPKKDLPFADASSEREGFLRGFMSTCTKTQQAAPENTGVSAAVINAFCSCSANSVADSVTRDEIAYIELHKTGGTSFIEKVNTSSQKCAERTLGVRP
jgi:hypothetical protein